MSAFLVLVAASGLLFFALVEMAFTLLMRLPERLEAERESDGGALRQLSGRPAALLRARAPDARAPADSLDRAAGPARGPGLDWRRRARRERASAGDRCRAVAASVPRAAASGAHPRTAAARLHRDRECDRARHGGDHRRPWLDGAARGLRPRDGRARREAPSPDAKRATSEADESRLLRSVVDFGETLVREVMTPRPDIVAIPATATIDDLRRLVQEQEYPACRSMRRTSTTSSAWSW